MRTCRYCSVGRVQFKACPDKGNVLSTLFFNLVLGYFLWKMEDHDTLKLEGWGDIALKGTLMTWIWQGLTNRTSSQMLLIWIVRKWDFYESIWRWKKKFHEIMNTVAQDEASFILRTSKDLNIRQLQ